MVVVVEGVRLTRMCRAWDLDEFLGMKADAACWGSNITLRDCRAQRWKILVD